MRVTEETDQAVKDDTSGGDAASHLKGKDIAVDLDIETGVAKGAVWGPLANSTGEEKKSMKEWINESFSDAETTEGNKNARAAVSTATGSSMVLQGKTRLPQEPCQSKTKTVINYPNCHETGLLVAILDRFGAPAPKCTKTGSWDLFWLGLAPQLQNARKRFPGSYFC